MEKQFLSNGLQFICTPSINQLDSYRSEYLKDMTRGWLRFERTLNLKFMFHDQSNDTKRIMKFVLPIEKRINSNNNHQWWIGNDIRPFLESYKRVTRPLLEKTIDSVHTRNLIRQQRMNYSYDDRAFIDNIMNDMSITCKPADKNLGLALVETSWYTAELRRMLADTNTYVRFDDRIKINNRVMECRSLPTDTHLPTLGMVLYDELQRLIEKNSNALMKWNADCFKQVRQFIQKRVDPNHASIPSIYLLIKVHKPKGLCGRPIVPCTNWLTTPASILVDHLLQEIFIQANIKHIVKDTKSLVNELEETIVSCKDGIFVTADISSLYTNIDTEMGLRLVRQFLEEQNIPLPHQELIMDLLSFVMHHSYLTFEDIVYHQIDGTAMGTQTAPIYANIIVYVLERTVIAKFDQHLHLYRRFLDDVFVYIDPDHADQLMVELNQLHPKLVFEFVTHPTEAIFLDLNIHKGSRFYSSENKFDLKVHQKPMNLYLYIPFSSYHTEASKRSFIQTELMRYIRNSSCLEYYLELKKLFYSRLRSRGYPHTFLADIFNSIWYRDRKYFLYPSSQLFSHPDLNRHPPQSRCLIRKLERGKEETSRVDPPVFIIPYNPLSNVVPTRSLLIKYWERIEDAIQLPKPIIAYQTCQSLMYKLVFQKASLMNKRQRESTNDGSNSSGLTIMPSPSTNRQ